MTGILLLLVGCYSYPPVPEPVDGDNFTNLPPEKHRSLPDEYAILTIAQAREVALLNNPDFRSIRHSMAAADARFYRAITSYLPTVDATYDFTEYRDITGGPTNGDVHSTKRTGFRGEWMVFNGLMRTMEVLSAKHAARQAAAQVEDARRLLLEAVGVAYNQVLLARKNIEIARADEQFNLDLLHDTELKYKAGTVSLSEVLNFRIRANDASTNVVRSEYNFDTARAILADLLGLTEGTIAPEKFPPLEQVVEVPEMGVDVYLDVALSNRPDLQAYREALTAAEYRLYARYGAYSPEIIAFADFGWQRDDPGYHGRGQLRYRKQDRFLDYGFKARLEVFDGGRRLFDLRESQAMVAQNQENLTARWITVVSEVRQAHDNFKQQVKLLAISERNLDLVKQTRDLVQEEYKAGSASLTRLNEVQRDLTVAETNLINARISLINARLHLDAVTGTNPTAAGQPVVDIPPGP